MGYSIDGGFGEYATAYARYAVKVPAGVDPARRGAADLPRRRPPASRRDDGASGRSRPSSSSTTRRPTSRRSAARSRKYSSSTAGEHVRLRGGDAVDRLGRRSRPRRSRPSPGRRSRGRSRTSPGPRRSPRSRRLRGSPSPAASAFRSAAAASGPPAAARVLRLRARGAGADGRRDGSRGRCRRAQPEQPADADARRTRAPDERRPRHRRQVAAVEPAGSPRPPRRRGRPAAAPTTLRRDPGGRCSARRGTTHGPSSRASGSWPPRRPRRRRGPRPARPRVPPPSSASRAAADAGNSASSIVFSPSAALPRPAIPPVAASSAATNAAAADGVLARQRAGAAEEGRPVERTGRAADRADEGLAGLAEEVGRGGGVGRAVRRPRPRVEHRDDGREPAVHVDPVIAVADRLVELGQCRRLFVNRSAAARSQASSPSCIGDPSQGVDASCRRLKPAAVASLPSDRRPRSDAPAEGGVWTGASHSLVSSSSSLSSVTEKPAISRLVM